MSKYKVNTCEKLAREEDVTNSKTGEEMLLCPLRTKVPKKDASFPWAFFSFPVGGVMTHRPRKFWSYCLAGGLLPPRRTYTEPNSDDEIVFHSLTL